ASGLRPRVSEVLDGCRQGIDICTGVQSSEYGAVKRLHKEGNHIEGWDEGHVPTCFHRCSGTSGADVAQTQAEQASGGHQSQVMARHESHPLDPGQTVDPWRRNQPANRLVYDGSDLAHIRPSPHTPQSSCGSVP